MGEALLRTGGAVSAGAVVVPAQRTSSGKHARRPADTEVEFRRVMTRRELGVYLVLLAVMVGLTARYVVWWFDPDHVPTNDAGNGWRSALLNLGPFIALTVLEALRMGQMAVSWLFALFMRSPVPQDPSPHLRVAVLTTIVPASEPLSMLEHTLVAMLRMRHPSRFDVWVLDEGNDDEVRALCSRLGVHHFSRVGVDAYNQASGPYKSRTKAGNHNAWADRHGGQYDVVAQMDPDHVPTVDFLEKSVGYFNDPDVAYVVAPQVYYRNASSSWIARGADEQNFGFSAITQRGANGLAMPILIGSNHLCRSAALRSVGGYASHIVEDHLTGMRFLTTTNPETGRRWKGVFTDAIISHGEGPSRWNSYLSQQLRWSYGLMDIIQNHSFRLLRRMRIGQVIGYVLLQSFYVSLAAILVIGVSLSSAHLVLGVDALDAAGREWLGHWLPQLGGSLALWYWLQRFYLRPEDRGWGLRGSFVNFGAVVTYTQALVLSAFRRPLAYVVTPKGEVGTREPLRLFKWHLLVLGASLATLCWAVAHDVGASSIRFWATLNVVEMALVVASGSLAPSVLRIGLQVRWLSVINRSATRVAVPLVLTVAALAVGVPGPDTVDDRPVALEQNPVAIPSDEVTIHAPARRVSARFLRPGSRQAVFGEFDLQNRLDVRARMRHDFINFSQGSIERLTDTVGWAAAEGQVALLSWEPKIPGRTKLSAGMLKEVSRGRYDGYVRRAADALRRTEQPVILRFAAEMDQATDELHPWAGRDPAMFVRAWRRVHSIFDRQGAHNVRFAWTPGGYFVGKKFASDDWYPGDAYVDVVGFSAYAFWGWEEEDPARVHGHTYRSPQELVGPRYEAIRRHGKPVILPEVGIRLHDSRLDEHEEWLRGFVRYADRLPRLAAVVYFHAPHGFRDYDIDWRLDEGEQRALRGSLAGSGFDLRRPSPQERVGLRGSRISETARS